MKTSFLRFSDFSVLARDAEVGRVRDVYFDTVGWRIRYLVLELRRRLGGRRALVSPQSADAFNPVRREIRLGLTRTQLEASPPVDEHVPITRTALEELDRHYGWAHWWITGGPIGFSFPTVNYGPIAESFEIPEDMREMIEARHEKGDDTLVSFRDLVGWRVETVDDDRAGSVRDGVINYQDWTLPYLVVDTGHWMPGRKVVLPSSFVETIDVERHAVAVRTSAESLATAPGFEIDEFDMHAERALVEHYFDRMEPGWLTARRGALPASGEPRDGETPPPP